MERLEFTENLSLLQSFFNMKFNESKINNWYDRLLDYPAWCMKKAVNKIIDNCDTAPSFSRLKLEITEIYKNIPRPKEIKASQITGGLAPLTPQKKKFAQELFAELRRAMDLKDHEALQSLKEIWVSGYPSLLDYHDKQACLRLVHEKNFKKLEELGA